MCRPDKWKSLNNIVGLDYLATDPAHMRRGAGALLMEWGVGKADELNLGVSVSLRLSEVLCYRSLTRDLGRHRGLLFGGTAISKIWLCC